MSWQPPRPEMPSVTVQILTSPRPSLVSPRLRDAPLHRLSAGRCGLVSGRCRRARRAATLCSTPKIEPRSPLRSKSVAPMSTESDEITKTAVSLAKRAIAYKADKESDDMSRSPVNLTKAITRPKDVRFTMWGARSQAAEEADLGSPCQRLRPTSTTSGQFVLDGYRSILCFGDSLTEGFCGGGRARRPYTERLSLRLRERGARPKILNAGVCSENTTAMLVRLPKLLTSRGPFDLVVILAGTNDLSASAPAEIVRNILQLHQMAFGVNAHTVLLTIPEVKVPGAVCDRMNATAREVNARLRSFALQHQDCVHFVDLAEKFPHDTLHAGLWEKDGLHFTAKGYEMIGDLLAELR